MRSSSARALVVAAVVALTTAATATLATTASAQQPAQGFAVNRLYPSAPGGGWMTMDALDMRGGLGGAASLTMGYAHAPLHVGSNDGSQRLDVVKNQASADFGFAVTYDRWRVYLDLDMPLVGKGTSGTVDGHAFTAPPVDLATDPDTLADARIGVDTRLVGEAKSAFRLGAGVQLFVPSGNRSDYLTDGTYRAMGRALVAGDIGWFTYAGHLGVHVRPLDDAETPGSPRGSEMLFGAAAGVKTLLGSEAGTALIVGPEIYGATPFRSFFGSNSTALEALLVGRLEGTADDGPQMRVKSGVGVGVDQQFGAPEWRLVFAIELFDHHSDGDGDGISDAKDACPSTPGVKTADPKTNGCPAAGDVAPPP